MVPLIISSDPPVIFMCRKAVLRAFGWGQLCHSLVNVSVKRSDFSDEWAAVLALVLVHA